MTKEDESSRHSSYLLRRTQGMTKNSGAIFSEVVIGRNIVKDVAEAVQSIYRGLIGGRTSMAVKRIGYGSRFHAERTL